METSDTEGLALAANATNASVARCIRVLIADDENISCQGKRELHIRIRPTPGACQLQRPKKDFLINIKNYVGRDPKMGTARHPIVPYPVDIRMGGSHEKGQMVEIKGKFYAFFHRNSLTKSIGHVLGFLQGRRLCRTSLTCKCRPNFQDHHSQPLRHRNHPKRCGNDG
jgi:hypothetical protein